MFTNNVKAKHWVSITAAVKDSSFNEIFLNCLTSIIFKSLQLQNKKRNLKKFENYVEMLFKIMYFLSVVSTLLSKEAKLADNKFTLFWSCQTFFDDKTI